jgi:hypothetical protein
VSRKWENLIGNSLEKECQEDKKERGDGKGVIRACLGYFYPTINKKIAFANNLIHFSQ